MTHPEMNELYDLYALGALESELATEIDQHIVDDCEYCLKNIRESVRATAMLSAMVDPVEPPKEVRRRLMAGLRGGASSRRRQLLVPALALACAALLVLGTWSSIKLLQTRDDLHRVAGERAQLQEALTVLSQAQPKMVQYGKAQTAHGTVFVNRNGGFVVIGSEMPRIDRDRTFELWLIPTAGNPIPAGLFRSGEGNTFVHTHQQPVDVSRIAAVAVTVEPKEGSLAPTTKPFLVVPIS